MNIKGYLFLQKHNLPLARKTIIFRKLSEIPKNYFNNLDEEERWVLIGSDDQIQISTGPYFQKQIKKKGFNIKNLNEIFNELKKELENKGIPSKNHIFLLFVGYLEKDVKFAGHALRDKNEIHIDLINKNRPSKRDWHPDYSIRYTIVNRKAIAHSSLPEIYQKYLAQIVKNIIELEESGCLEFVILEDEFLFYNDFYTVKN